MKVSRIVLCSIIIAGLIAGCSGASPIDTGNMVVYQHNTHVFSLKVPKSWTQTQDAVPTEALAAFSDPTGHAEILAYAGLLDHTLTDQEALDNAEGLMTNLLNRPADLKTLNKQRRDDGAYVVDVSFTRADQKRKGQGVFRQSSLGLSGVIIDGPEQGWSDLQQALQPTLDSFQSDDTVIQGTFFSALNETGYALALPADWTRSRRTDGIEIRSLTGKIEIYTIERPYTETLDAPAMTEQAAAYLRQSFGLQGTVAGSEPQSDGRLKMTLNRSDRQTVGYVEQKDGYLLGLFFDVPADRAQDYQAFIDFVYSTYVTGKAS
jgi:hypothetical protein